MIAHLRRLAQPQHRLWLCAALLLAIALVAAWWLTPVASEQRRAAEPREAAGQPVGSLVGLIELTSDQTSALPEGDDARAANAALPLIANGIEAAPGFRLSTAAMPAEVDRARDCLALAMYYEAGYEGAAGRRAVAQVVLNRMRHPAFPHSVCGVVFQRSVQNVCQFTFACDGAMLRPRQPALWAQTLREAGGALAGQVYAPVGMATHYHADYVFPDWAPQLDKIAAIGTHIFYRWPRGWGLRRVFTAKYQGSEPDLSGLADDVVELVTEETLVPEELRATASEAPPFRAENDGGFIDPSKGWVPRISTPPHTAGNAAPETTPTTAP